MLHILSGAQVRPLTWLLLIGHVLLKGEEPLSSARGGPLPQEAPPYSLSPFLLPRSPDMARSPDPAPTTLSASGLPCLHGPQALCTHLSGPPSLQWTPRSLSSALQTPEKCLQNNISSDSLPGTP